VRVVVTYVWTQSTAEINPTYVPNGRAHCSTHQHLAHRLRETQ